MALKYIYYIGCSGKKEELPLSKNLFPARKKKHNHNIHSVFYHITLIKQTNIYHYKTFFLNKIKQKTNK